MNVVNIFRYRPRHMKADLFRSIAHDLRFEGELMESDEGMVIHNGRAALVYSQPNAKFGGLLFFADQERSLAEPAKELPDTERVKKYVDRFLERFDLLPRRGDYEVTIKLEAKATQAMVADEEGEVRRVPVRADIFSQIELDNLPVIGPRAKIRAAYGDGETPRFLHVGLWKTVEPYAEGELIPEDRLHAIIDDRVKRREEKLDLRVRDIRLAYRAGEYRGGADLLEPYYFVEIEHGTAEAREEGAGPRQVMQLRAYN